MLYNMETPDIRQQNKFGTAIFKFVFYRFRFLVRRLNRDFLDDRSHKCGRSERRVRLPDDILRTVKVIRDASDEQKAVFPISDNGLQNLIEFRVDSNALVSCCKLHPHLILLDDRLSRSDRTQPD
jgi:hypothetical protein